MSGIVNSRLVRRGAITGAGAFVGGAILVLVFAFLVGGMLGALASLAPVSTATMGYAALHAWVAMLDGSPQVLVFALIPGAILVGAGYSAARQTSDLPTSPVTRGAAVTVGYLSVVVLSILYTIVRAGAVPGTYGGGVGADFFGVAVAIVFTGLAFPLVFGALGGWLAQARGY